MGAIKTGWDFFQNQILGMHWLKDLIGNGALPGGDGRVVEGVDVGPQPQRVPICTAGDAYFSDFLYSELFSTGEK